MLTQPGPIPRHVPRVQATEVDFAIRFNRDCRTITSMIRLLWPLYLRIQARPTLRLPLKLPTTCSLQCPRGMLVQTQEFEDTIQSSGQVLRQSLLGPITEGKSWMAGRSAAHNRASRCIGYPPRVILNSCNKRRSSVSPPQRLNPVVVLSSNFKDRAVRNSRFFV